MQKRKILILFGKKVNQPSKSMSKKLVAIDFESKTYQSIKVKRVMSLKQNL